MLSFLKEEIGFEADFEDFYTKVSEWEKWYQGYDSNFHQYTLPSPARGRKQKREMYTMKMGTKIPQDIASLLLNEKTRIELDDAKSNLYLQGEDGESGVFGDTGFWVSANQLVERTAALGTGAIVARVKETEVAASEDLRGGRIVYEYITAGNIIPLSWENDRIIDVAFASEVMRKGKRYIYLEMHCLEEDGYVITNRFFTEQQGSLVPEALPEDILPEMRTLDVVPLFAIFKLNIANNVADIPLGVSAYANCIDNLKAVDLAFHNFCVDFQLGRKMVFMKQDMMDVFVSESGERFTSAPQEQEQSLFTFIGTDTEGNSELIYEFNPNLRVDDNERGMQAMLNYLSSKVGLGEKYYRFDGGRVGVNATATQVVSENSALYRNIQRHNILIKNSLIAVVRATLWLAANVIGESVDSLTKVNVYFDDSVIEDKGSEIKQDLEMLKAGVLSVEEFRAKHIGNQLKVGEDSQGAEADNGGTEIQNDVQNDEKGVSKWTMK